MNNQPASQIHKSNSSLSQFPTFTRFFSKVLKITTPIIPYLILWISANGMTWLPGFYKTVIWDGYGGHEDQYPIFFMGLSILISILMIVVVIVAYRAGKNTQNQRKALTAGFVLIAALGGIFTIMATLWSVYIYSPYALVNPNANLIPIEIYAAFFIIGLINARVAKQS